MHNQEDKIEQEKQEWKDNYYQNQPERSRKFTTISGVPVEELYTPDNISELDYLQDLGFPGQYPYTRGIHSNMYRGRLWTMRQFSGFGDAFQSNQRFKYLLEQGQTGLSVAFDMPTIMGYDSDHWRSRGEVGRCGVAVDTLQDMENLFAGIPLDQVTTSMTINGPAAVLWAMYIATAENQNVPLEKLGGTIQNDILKEYMAQKSWIFPPEPSMRLITDTLEFGIKHLPRWNTISISGYHIREAGSNALQELAFTLANGFAYVEAGMEAGLDVDDFAPRLSFFFNAHIDIFEEIAKYRVARKIWARRMKEKYRARDPRSWMLRFHTQTAGCSLAAQEPENNIIRTAFEALAAVLGGTQSLHTNSMDEVMALPSEKAVKIALRTQQVLAYETGVANTIDPLGGSYFVENMTREMEQQAEDYLQRIKEKGGVLKGIEEGFFQREIADASYRYQKELEQKEKILVGVNEFKSSERSRMEIMQVGPEVEENQAKRLNQVKQNRDGVKVSHSLEDLKKKASTGENLMPFILEAVRSYATEGEIIAALKEVFGEYRETPVF